MDFFFDYWVVVGFKRGEFLCVDRIALALTTPSRQGTRKQRCWMFSQRIIRPPKRATSTTCQWWVIVRLFVPKSVAEREQRARDQSDSVH